MTPCEVDAVLVDGDKDAEEHDWEDSAEDHDDRDNDEVIMIETEENMEEYSEDRLPLQLRRPGLRSLRSESRHAKL